MTKNILTIFILTCFYSVCFSQTDNKNIDTNDIFGCLPDDLPEFPGGDDSLYSFIYRNLKYPIDSFCVDRKTQVQFVVDTSGTIKNIEIIKHLTVNCDNEAIRIFKLMPKWKPVYRNHKPVETKQSYQFTFRHYK